MKNKYYSFCNAYAILSAADDHCWSLWWSQKVKSLFFTILMWTLDLKLLICIVSAWLYALSCCHIIPVILMSGQKIQNTGSNPDNVIHNLEEQDREIALYRLGGIVNLFAVNQIDTNQVWAFLSLGTVCGRGQLSLCLVFYTALWYCMSSRVKRRADWLYTSWRRHMAFMSHPSCCVMGRTS